MGDGCSGEQGQSEVSALGQLKVRLCLEVVKGGGVSSGSQIQLTPTRLQTLAE